MVITSERIHCKSTNIHLFIIDAEADWDLKSYRENAITSAQLFSFIPPPPGLIYPSLSQPPKTVTQNALLDRPTRIPNPPLHINQSQIPPEMSNLDSKTPAQPLTYTHYLYSTLHLNTPLILVIL